MAFDNKKSQKDTGSNSTEPDCATIPTMDNDLNAINTIDEAMPITFNINYFVNNDNAEKNHTDVKSNNKMVDDAKIFSDAWACSFRKLNGKQQLFAKKLIDHSLFMGHMEMLTFHSNIKPSLESFGLTNSPPIEAYEDFNEFLKRLKG